MNARTILLLLAVSVVAACSKFLPDPPVDDTLLDGPVEGLSAEEQLRFLAGDAAFNDEVFSSATGLGPIFVSTSCGSCHPGDGRGHPFTSLVRFGQLDGSGNQYLEQGGPQLQHRALPGFAPETIPAGATHSTLLPPPNTGLGFLDAVPDAALLALADPDDLDGDGISGAPNWVTPPAYCALRSDPVFQAGKTIGRFGRKGAVYDLLQQTANAYNQDIGITSAYEPVDVYSGAALDPEVATATVEEVVFYLRTLKAPVQRDADDPQVIDGEGVFLAIGCGKCHVPQLTSGPSPIAALANKAVRPFTDLLLHDMGPGLDDGYTEGSALTSEWKTPPLWGLGLSPNSQGGSFYLLHDGRARSVEEAITLHAGEGEASRNAFTGLSSSDREALLRFLESL